MTPVLLTLLSMAGAIALFAYVLSPLKQEGSALGTASDTSNNAPPTSAQVTLLSEDREAALAGLAELDFDHSLGNLSEEDYLHLRTRYRAQAIEILKSLDAEAPGRVAPSRVKLRPGDTPSPSVAALILETSAPRVSGQATAGAQPLDRRAALIMLGGVAAALVATAIGMAWLRGPGSAVSSPEGAPPLNIMHAHAALLVPNTNVALVAHHNGLLRSTDDGINWLPVGQITGDVSSLVGSEATGSAIFLATGDKVMSSADRGVTWLPSGSPSSGGRIEALAVGDNQPTMLYAYVAGKGLYSTADLQKWGAVGSQLTTDVVGMAFRPGPLAALYVASPGEGVLASGDEGRTWGSANGLLNSALPTLAVRALTFGAESGDQFTEPDGTRLTGAMYTGTDLGLFKTIDGGSSWSPMPLREPLAAVSSRSNPTPLLLAVDSRSRLWRSEDKGNSWNIANKGSTGSAGNTGSAKP